MCGHDFVTDRQRQMDGQTTVAKTICLPTLKGGDIIVMKADFPFKQKALRTKLMGLGQGHHNLINSFNYPNDTIHNV